MDVGNVNVVAGLVRVLNVRVNDGALNLGLGNMPLGHSKLRVLAVRGFQGSTPPAVRGRNPSCLQRLLRQTEGEVDEGADGDAAGAFDQDALVGVEEVDAGDVEVRPRAVVDELLEEERCRD